MRRRDIETKILAALMIVFAVVGCGGSSNLSSGGGSTSTGSSYPGTPDGAKALLAEFAKPGADTATLSKSLRPTKADYDAVFAPELAAKADSVYGPAWDGGQLVIAPKPGQTQVLVSHATTDELKSGAGGAADFANGWKDVSAQLKPGVTFYTFKFVEPGQSLGMAYDGLAYVNGNWRIFPKPWKVMR
ncbi:MAG TPA: hypothetical protein VLJ61_16480 [Pyrinomonadaceae bacterium]|nr:hypothetical protein [Pyrinomonadaceae bacterium]